MADLSMRNVAKSYGNVRVIEDLSLDIADGEFAVLVGPSGCGKSTLLRMIAGLETITAGDLEIGGKRTNNVPPQQRNISMVFQSYALFPHMSVERNISFGPRVRGEPEQETRTRIGKASDILNLSDYLDRLPRQLSGGQRQRVAMGRSIVRDPQVFLFDEPLSNLDAKLRVQMRTEIKALHQKLGTTIVYVTHDQIEAMTMADRIVVMNGGNIEQVGAPIALYDRPINTFVAGFIGSPAMSFLKGCYRQNDTGAAIELSNGSLLKVPPVEAAYDQPVTIGIRPETYRLADDGPIKLVVDVVEPTGAETHIYGQVAGQPVRCVFYQRLMPKSGETLSLAVAPENVHVFDKQTGTRLDA